MDPLNGLALFLFGLALYGCWGHWDAEQDARQDREALRLTGCQDALDSASVEADIKEERLRLYAKIAMAVMLLSSAFSPRTSLAELDIWGWVSTICFLAMMFFLTRATRNRKQNRRRMLFLALADKGKQGGVG